MLLIVLVLEANRAAVLSKSAESILEAVIKRDPHELEYIQAVQEVVHSLEAVLAKHPQYARSNSVKIYELVLLLFCF